MRMEGRVGREVDHIDKEKADENIRGNYEK
jgi:hypothetical protein